MSRKTSTSPTSTRDTAHRRRGAALENALLEAAWEEVTAVGYPRLTMEGVATRAATDKSVLYRRWPNRASLVRAAIRHRFGSAEEHVPDTGDLRQDLVSVLQSMRDTFQQVGADVAYGLLAEQPDLPLETFNVVPSATRTILERAASRGQLTAERITPLITSVSWAILRNKLMTSPDHVPDAFLEDIIDHILLPLLTQRP